MLTCPSCAAPLSDAARFCPNCGAPQAGQLNEERRIVSVVFADVVGFTTLSEHRDPEQVKRLIDGCFAGLVADVNAFGGRVDKILGDGILALFGAPVAHEDDAERAVRAALRMQESAAAYAAAQDVSLRLRIGVHTGEVLVGALRSGGDYTAMGDVVNTAARLQAEAEPGCVLVGEATQALTADVIRYRRFGAVRPRGRQTPVDAYVAEAPVDRPGSRRRHDAPFVGRDRELALLVAGLEYSLRDGRAFLAAVEGDGGVGKTRLVREACRIAAERLGVPVLEGRCVPYGEANAWFPVASALSAYLGLDGAPDEAVTDMLRERAAEVLDPNASEAELRRIHDAVLHLLGRPSSLDRLDPARAWEEVTRAVVFVLGSRVRQGPVVVAITDVHWADPQVLNLFGRVLQNLAGRPFALLTTARPSAELAWPPGSGSPFTTVHLRLGPLDPAASATLVRSVVGDDVTDDVVTTLYDRSGGNPLFLGELARLVAEHGESGTLPESLRALVAARLDELPADQRAMLENAAVLGTSGHWRSLERFSTALGTSTDRSTLQGLVDAGLLDLDGKQWRFRSESVREVAYATLTKASRAMRHAGIAHAMADLPERFADEVAHHLAAAAELVIAIGPVHGVPADILERAVAALVAAGERAQQQHLDHVVIHVATRGLHLLEAAPPGDEAAGTARRRLLCLRGEALTDRRRLPEARDDITALVDEARRDGDVLAEAIGLRLWGEHEHIRGELARAAGHLGTSVELLRALDEPLVLARSLRSRAFTATFQGRHEDARRDLDEAERICLAHDDRRGRAWVEEQQAWLAFMAGDLEVATARLEAAAATMSELGDRGGLGFVLGLMAYTRLFRGRQQEADELAQLVHAEAVERGDDWATAMMETLQATLRLWEGRTERAASLAEEARATFRRIGDGFGESQAIAVLVRSSVALARPGTFDRLPEQLQSIGDKFGLAEFTSAAVAGAAVHAGEPERALAALARVDGPRRRPPTLDGEVNAALARLMLGEADAARAALEAAQAAAPMTSPFAEAALALVAAAEGAGAEAVERAGRVVTDPASTYLDRAYAWIAAAFGHARTGDVEAAASAVDRAQEVVQRTGDVTARAIVAVTRARIGGGDATAVPADAPIPGWRLLLGRMPVEVAVP
jgi:class 3 adenylate cyclase/tetratricopeptide (TPR) repeat protein